MADAIAPSPAPPTEAKSTAAPPVVKRAFFLARVEIIGKAAEGIPTEQRIYRVIAHHPEYKGQLSLAFFPYREKFTIQSVSRLLLT